MFNFSFDKRILYIVMGILVVMNLAQYAMVEGAILGLVLSLPGVIIAITFHEFAHAFAADKLGDDTARREGRLNLNPLNHFDPIGTFLLVFAGFGWGKPVHVNPRNYTRKISMETGEAIVSFAGPLMNFILAIVFSLILSAVRKFVPIDFLQGTYGGLILLILRSVVTINVGLGLFNLIPLPPLDGSKVIMPFLPYKAKAWFAGKEQLFYIIFIVLWITGIAGIIISPAISVASTGILNLGRLIFGI